MGNLDFNVEPPSEKELQSSYDDTPIPEGTYQVELSKGVMGDTAAGTGSWLRLHYTVLQGEQRNRALRPKPPL